MTLDDKTLTIDCQYLGKPEHTAAFLLVDGERAAFVENNTTFAVPRLLKALEGAGLSPEQVELAIITHVHLDHAGGSAALLEACPNARLVAHPRAAPHVVDPSRLVASSRAVYGGDFDRLYGEVAPVPRDRVHTVEDGEVIHLGDRALTFLHTLGHAKHHVCVHDSGSGGVFVGDTFGVIYPPLQTRGMFAFPSTTPTDFDPEAAKETVHRIAGYGASCIMASHFGVYEDIDRAAEQLLALLDSWHLLRDRAAATELAGDDLATYCEDQVRRDLEGRVHDAGLGLDAAQLIQADIRLNAVGIAIAAERYRARLGR